MITPCFPSAPRLCACSLFALAVAIATPAAAQATDDAPSTAPCPDGSVPSADGACVASPEANGLAVQDAATSPDSDDSAGGDIVVTGPRIPRRNIDTGQPTLVLHSSPIEQHRYTRSEERPVGKGGASSC